MPRWTKMFDEVAAYFEYVVPSKDELRVIEAIKRAIGSYFNEGEDLVFSYPFPDSGRVFNTFVRVTAPGMTREIANIGLAAAKKAGALWGEVV